MGRHWLDFDPAGYQWTEEPGFDARLDGRDLARIFALRADPKQILHRFYNPEGAAWSMTRPKQFRPAWYASAELDDHVIRRAAFSFATGVVTYESELTRKPTGVSFPDNQFITTIIPSSFTSLDARNYSNLFTAAGVVAPAGAGTVATAGTTPLGATFTGIGREFTPWFHFLTYPAPDSWFLCGFSNLAFLHYDGYLHVLRNPANDGVTWELLKMFPATGLERQTPHNPYVPFPLVQTESMARMSEQRLCVVPYTRWHIETWLNSQAAQFSVRTPGEAEGDPQFPVGPYAGKEWWIAAAPNTKFHYQCQVMGYDTATTDTLAPFYPTRPSFDLTAEYAAGGPTLPPLIGYRYAMNKDPAAAWIEGTDAGGFLYTESPTTGQRVTAGLTKTDYTVWVSDGVQYKGGFKIILRPSTQATYAGYLPTGLNWFEFSFPEKLAPRVHDLLRLSDTEFAAWECEANYDDPLGKRMSLFFFADGLHAINGKPHHRRDWYPVHAVEDADDNGIPETVRAAGWVLHGGFTEELAAITGDTRPTPKRYYRMDAAGLLTRGQKHSLYLPVVVPAAGKTRVAHTEVARRVLKGIGFDVDDPDSVYIHPEAFPDEDRVYLPGSGGSDTSTTAAAIDKGWLPDWDEGSTAYLARIAGEWRGWQLYEDLAGKVWYVPNLIFELELGESYFKTADIWADSAGAAAGSLAGQYFLEHPTWETVPPVCNTVRVTAGEAGDEGATHVLDRERQAWTGATIFENFAGEPITRAINPKLAAVDDVAKKQCARVFLVRNHRRRRLLKWQMPLAPWEMASYPGAGPPDIGHVVEVEGHGVFQVIGLSVTLLRSAPGVASSYRSRWVGELLPNAATAGTGTGTMDYPGHFKPA